MTDLRKAAEMALPLLVAYQDYTGDSRIANKCGEAIEALHQALNVNAIDTSKNCVDENKKRERKPWVSLTDEEKSDVIGDVFGNIFAAPQKSLILARAIEAKLKVKNT